MAALRPGAHQAPDFGPDGPQEDPAVVPFILQRMALMSEHTRFCRTYLAYKGFAARQNLARPSRRRVGRFSPQTGGEVYYTVIGQFTEMSRNARNIRFPTSVSSQNERHLLVVKTGGTQL